MIKLLDSRGVDKMTKKRQNLIAILGIISVSLITIGICLGD